MKVSSAPSAGQSRKDAPSPSKESPEEFVGENEHQATAAETPAPQNQEQNMQTHLSDDEYVVVDAWDDASPAKKRRRSLSGDSEQHQSTGDAVQQSTEKEGEDATISKENGQVGTEKETQNGEVQAAEAEDKGEVQEHTTQSTSEREQTKGDNVGVEEELEVNIGDDVDELPNEELQTAEVVVDGEAENKSKEDKGEVHEQTTQFMSQQEQAKEDCASMEQERNVNIGDDVEELSEKEATELTPARVPSPAVHISGVDMMFPEDEVPIELCPFSSDGSVEDPPLEQSTTRESNGTGDAPPDVVASVPTTPTAPNAELSLPAEAAPTTLASVTAEESATQSEAGRSMGRRKRRKKLNYSTSRKRDAAKTSKEQNNVPTSPAGEDKLSIAVNGHAVQNGGDIDSDKSRPPSPVYPDADASHLYPSTPEGAPWQWEDVDPYFDPLAQSDLDNLVRWRKENANFIAANPSVWRGMLDVESKRAVLDVMVADASDATTDHVEYPIRRGRNYRDVWEEKDFLAQYKRIISGGETNLKSQLVKMKKKRKVTFNAEDSLVVSHRDLVYGYDDNLFQDFRGRLEDRVKACQSSLPPSTPPTPPTRRQQSVSAKVEENAIDATAHEVTFEEEVLPSFPVSHLHPASLGLWKLRKNQEPDFTVVHPSSLNRVQVPVRWREEIARHHQQQYELQLQQTDAFADPSDGDDEGTGDSSHERPRVTISNSDITGGLPSFGDCIEEDEISQVLAASVSKLVPLSMLNWRTAQLVYERSACSIQCAPILEGEAAAARELEDVYLQLCPPGDAIDELNVPLGTVPARRPRTTQINSVPHDMIAYSVRRDVADNCSLAVAASVEFALGLHVGDVVDVLDRNGCWNYGEVVETYSENSSETAKFVLLRFSLWSEDTVEWIAVSEGRLLPRGVADGSRPCSVGPTRAHRVGVRYDQSLARELERSFPQRQAKQATAASHMLAHRRQTALIRSSNEQQKTPQKRKRKRPAKSTAVPLAT